MNEKLRKILQRKKEIRAKLNAQIEGTVELTDEEIKALQGELENLNEEEEAAVEEAEQDEQRKNAEELTKRNKVGELRIVNRPGEEKRNADDSEELTIDEKSKRGKALREKRAITVGSSQIAVPKYTANGVKGTFNEVSTLIDLVTVTPLEGGESYERGYVVSHGEGGAIDNDGNYHQADTVFNYAEINKQKITAYSEEPEEVKRLADAAYHDEIVKGMTIATKKKLSKDILVGDGTKGRLQGIFTNPNKFAIDSNTDIEISVIDNKTLNKIIYAYAGDEDVVADACLILCKKDLQEFANVKTNDGKDYYDIEINGNTGKINKVPFVLNSAANSLKTANVGDYCMAYGSLSNYEVALFSALEVKESEDYKFKEGQIAHRGSVFAGGNVVAHNGFVRVKKAAAEVEEG